MNLIGQRMYLHGWAWMLAAFFVVLSTPAIWAQSASLDEQGRPVAYFEFVETGVPSIEVSVWGDVSASGRYKVREGMNLLEFLFLAGGPTERTRTEREIRNTSIRLSRRNAEGWYVLYEASLEDMLSLAAPAPAMQNDDILKVETVVKTRLAFRDVIQVVASIGTLVLVADRVFTR